MRNYKVTYCDCQAQKNDSLKFFLRFSTCDGLASRTLEPGLLLAVMNEIQEKLVNARVIGKFGMERGGHGASLPHYHGVSAFGCDHFNAVANVRNFRGSDENHLQGRLIELAIQITQQLPFPDRAVDLASVSVTADPDVERAEPGLWRILDFAGQQDCAGAGAESRFEANELLELLKTSGAEKFEEGAGLAPGNDESVDLIELLWFLDQHYLGTELFETAAVRIEVALQGKDTDLGSNALHSMSNSI